MLAEHKSDSEVIREVRGGNIDDFALLVRRYQSLAYGLAFSLVGDFATAEDICQDAFIAAYRNLARLREPERFAPWLKRIVRNGATGYLRGARRMQLALENKVVTGQMQKSSDTSEQNPEEDEFARQIRQWLALYSGYPGCRATGSKSFQYSLTEQPAKAAGIQS